MLIIKPIITFLSFAQQVILTVASWFFSQEKTTWTQNYEKLWSNTRERTQSKEKEQAEDSTYPRGIEVLLRETALKGS